MQNALLKRLTWACAAAICLASCTTGVLAQDRPDPRFADIRNLVEAHVDAGLFEGVILVAEGDTVIFHEAYGFADRTWGIPNQRDTRFHIGSIGKQMTGAIVMQLIEEGKLSLDMTISDILPEYPVVHGDKVTLNVLLNHTSGIPNYTSMPEYRSRASNAATRKDVLALFKDKPLEFEPGTNFSYNNSGFFLLSVMIEEIEGQPYGQVLQRRLFDALSLQDMGYIDHGSIIPNFAEGYNWTGTGYAPEVSTDESWILGNAQIYADADDLLKWTNALYAGEPFRTAESRDLMLELPEGKERNYSFGFGNVTLRLGDKTYQGAGHSGALGGFRSTQSRIVEPKWTIIALSNIGSEQNELSNRIALLLAGAQYTFPKPPISRQVSQRLATDGVEATRSWFLSELANQNSQYDIDEIGMNSLGYSYLSNGEISSAILVLSLNNQAYPESANTYDSLGEAYLVAGDKPSALANYKIALEMDPANSNAKAQVNALRGTVLMEQQ
ncbi:MAG: serine hydrolase [Pseudomonadota bacterium]